MGSGVGCLNSGVQSRNSRVVSICAALQHTIHQCTEAGYDISFTVARLSGRVSLGYTY